MSYHKNFFFGSHALYSDTFGKEKTQKSEQKTQQNFRFVRWRQRSRWKEFEKKDIDRISFSLLVFVFWVVPVKKRRMMRICLLFLFAAVATVAVSMPTSYPTSGVTTFSHALKNMPLLPGKNETELYATDCNPAKSGTICAVTTMHIPSIYPGQGCPWDWENGRLRLYVDGEATAAYDVTLLEVANVGSRAAIGDNRPSDPSPFGHTLFGKTASSGGVYTTLRVPFQKSLRVTVTPPSTCNTQMTFWFVIRGVKGIPGVIFGDFLLPPTARLRTLHNVTRSVPPLGYVTVTAPAGGGTLAVVMQDVQSTDLNYLEGCVRAFVDGASDAQFLSSGTEDYYMSASYWDEGLYTTPLAGLTYKSPGNNATASYKTHERDPVMWTSSFQLAFRNFEVTDGSPGSCPYRWGEGGGERRKAPPPNLKVGPADFSILVWLYTW